MPPSDTFFAAAPHWSWLVILYFFFGGIAGGSYFIAAMLDLFGSPEDHSMARMGYLIAFPAVVLCAPLLIFDLTQPGRFWHMIVQSNTGWPMFKWWAPMSVGSWALAVFGLFAFVSFIGALIDCGTVRWTRPRFLASQLVGHIFIVLGAMAGFFLASYTGVLLSVTNNPIWADSPLVGLVFLASAASTGAAAMLLLSRGGLCPPVPYSRALVRRFDSWMMWLELVVLTVFVFSLGAVAIVWLSVWGLLLVVGVVLIGILIPLGLESWPRSLGRATIPTAAVLVLLGGFILRAVIVFAAQTVV